MCIGNAEIPLERTDRFLSLPRAVRICCGTILIHVSYHMYTIRVIYLVPGTILYVRFEKCIPGTINIGTYIRVQQYYTSIDKATRLLIVYPGTAASRSQGTWYLVCSIVDLYGIGGR